ncbi:hypothetical protein GGF46_001542 [Coemansia sp. RSA 552]|nr:hypothetical protein GGF46_001542 [Coemansia sp. RSA 552]
MAEPFDSLPFFVRALYPFKSDEASGLTFDRGEIVEVLACLESGWWNGICKNNRGWFPSNYVEHVPPEQAQLLRQALQSKQPPQQPPQQPQPPQLQQQPLTPTTPGSASQPSQTPRKTSSAGVGGLATMDQSLLTAAANESVYRRGSIAVGEGQANVASAVPSRLRMGRRGSAPFSSGGSDADAAAAATAARARSGSADVSSTAMALQAPGSGTSDGTAAPGSHVSQWESRATLDGRTYYCNIFTDRTAWGIPSESADSADASGPPLELMGDEATLVYVSLVMSQQQDNRSDGHNAYALADPHASLTNRQTASSWEQLSAGIALTAFGLAASVSAQAKHEYLPLMLQIVAGVKRLLLSSSPSIGGSGSEHGGPIYRTHHLLHENHKDIVQYMCALMLSARVASTVWPPPDAAEAVHADIAGLIRAVRRFIAEAESVGITAVQPAISDDSVVLFPGADIESGRLRGPAAALDQAVAGAFARDKPGAKRLSTLQRNEHTGATVLVKGDGATSPVAAASSEGGATGESLFAKDRTGIRQRLRQHLAEHHQRSNKSSAPAPAPASAPTSTSPASAGGASPSLSAGAPLEVSPRQGDAPGIPATADALLQLEEGTHELARVILAFDRYLRKIERFYTEDVHGGRVAEAEGAGGRALSNGLQAPSRQPSINHMRSAADARLVAYAKHLVAALAVLLQILDDFDPYTTAVVSVAANDDPASTQSGPASIVLASMESLRTLRAQVNDGVGALVASTQDFADLSFRYSTAEDSSANREDGQDDPEITGARARPVPADRILSTLAQVGSALQSLNHNTMALHIGAKRVVEACDVCDLRGLWLRISSFHAAPNMLASVPGGPAGAAVRSTGPSSTVRRPGYRRSSSLPQLRRASGSLLGQPRSAHALSGSIRPRADTVDGPRTMPPHLARRFDRSGYANGDTGDLADDGRGQATRDTRVKDKLNRFFGDDPSQFSQSKRPAHMEDLNIVAVGSRQPGSAHTPTRGMSGYGDEQGSINGAPAPSVMSSRSSGRAVSNATGSSPAPQDQKPWYLGYDSTPEEMILTSDGQVKGSTLSALIERLVAHDVSDPNFVSTFLLTYHSFTTTPELFEGMFRRFLIQPPAGLIEGELNEWTERKLKPVRLRVYNLFKTWLEQHYIEQVEGDPQGLEMLREFACTTMADYMSNAADQLVRLIDKRRASQGGLRRMVPNLPHAAPAPILPRSLSRLRLMDINPQELARQFTLIDSNLFNKVRPIECLKTAWSRKPGDPKVCNGLNTEIAVNVKAMSTLSTQTTLWVTANILLEHEIKRRAAVIKYFISFAEHCRALNNFNTLMSVLGALTSVPVERLTRTWQAVQQKPMGTYNQLRQIMRTDRNFAEYRDSLHSCNPPAIPFVGVYLQDLTFIEDGNDDMITNSPGLINFAKRQRTAGTIRDLQQFQNVPYNLTPVAEIQDWLLKRLEELCPNGHSSDRLVEEFWKMSTTLEPKEKDSERVLRLLKESGFL